MGQPWRPLFLHFERNVIRDVLLLAEAARVIGSWETYSVPCPHDVSGRPWSSGASPLPKGHVFWGPLGHSMVPRLPTGPHVTRLLHVVGVQEIGRRSGYKNWSKNSEKVLLVSGYFELRENQRFSLVFRFQARDACQMR